MLGGLRKLQCPNCGATIQTRPTGGWVRCEYCATMLQMPGDPPPTAGPSGEQPGAHPVASYTVSKWAYVTPAFLVLTGALAVARGPLAHLRGAAAMPSPLAAATRSIRWSSSMPLPCAADGRLVGWGTRQNDHLVMAIDGQNGNRAWTTAALDADPAQSVLACAGDAAIVVSHEGVAYAFALSDGAPRWKTPVGERATSVCSAGPSAVLVALADERWVRLALADGAMTQVKKQRCEPLWSTEHTWPHGEVAIAMGHVVGDESNLSIPGMRIARVLEDPAGGRLVAVGEKSPGTAVPMAAAYTCKQVTLAKNFFDEPEYRCAGPHEAWKLEVPEEDAMDAQSLAPFTLAALRDGHLYVGYSLHGAHIAAIDVATGKRLWDLATPNPHHTPAALVQSIVPAKGRLAVTEFGSLDVFDGDTGKTLFEVE